jgi:hypothetical protein
MSSDARGRPQLARLAKGLVWEPDGTWPGLSHLPITLISIWPNLFQLSTTNPPSYSGMQDADFEVISDSVIRFEYCYLLRPTSTSAASVADVPYNQSITSHSTIDFCNDVAAVIVSIVVLDNTSRAIVTDYSRIGSQSVFADSSTGDTAATWTAAINQPNFATSSNIPKSAASGLRIYQRRFSFFGDGT